MLTTFKETIASLRDPDYAKHIQKKSLRDSFLYLLRYLLFFTAIPVILSVAALTYYTPQLDNLIRDNFPDLDLTVENGRASTSVVEPVVMDNEGVRFVLDPSGSPADLDNFTSGVLLLEDKILIKSPDGQVQTRDLKDFGDFHFDTNSAADWVGSHQLTVLGIGLAAIAIFTVLMFLIYTLTRLGLLIIAAAVLWAVSRILHRHVSFESGFKIVLHASVLPLIISAITVVSPSPVIDLLVLGLFVYYTISWYRSTTS